MLAYFLDTTGKYASYVYDKARWVRVLPEIQKSAEELSQTRPHHASSMPTTISLVKSKFAEYQTQQIPCIQNIHAAT